MEAKLVIIEHSFCVFKGNEELKYITTRYANSSICRKDLTPDDFILALEESKEGYIIETKNWAKNLNVLNDKRFEVESFNDENESYYYITLKGKKVDNFDRLQFF